MRIILCILLLLVFLVSCTVDTYTKAEIDQKLEERLPANKVMATIERDAEQLFEMFNERCNVYWQNVPSDEFENCDAYCAKTNRICIDATAYVAKYTAGEEEPLFFITYDIDCSEPNKQIQQEADNFDGEANIQCRCCRI